MVFKIKETPFQLGLCWSCKYKLAVLWQKKAQCISTMHCTKQYTPLIMDPFLRTNSVTETNE